MAEIFHIDDMKGVKFTGKVSYYTEKILNSMGIETDGVLDSPKDMYYMAGYSVILGLLYQWSNEKIFQYVREPHKTYYEMFYKDFLKTNIDLTPYIQDIENYRYELWAEGQPSDEPIEQVN